MGSESYLSQLHHPDRRKRKQARKKANQGELVIRESGAFYRQLSRALTQGKNLAEIRAPKIELKTW